MMDNSWFRYLDANARKVASIAAYAACSIGMIILNKSILSQYEFRNTLFLLVVQNALALFWTLVSTKVPPLTMKRTMQWLPINLAFLVMLYTGFRGLEYLKLTMVTVLKNCTNILILAADWYLYGQTVNARVSVAAQAGRVGVCGCCDGYQRKWRFACACACVRIT
jgi:hypothetical protein